MKNRILCMLLALMMLLGMLPLHVIAESAEDPSADHSSDLGKYVKLNETVGTYTVGDGTGNAYTYLLEDFTSDTILRITGWKEDASGLWYCVEFYKGSTQGDYVAEFPATPWFLQTGNALLFVECCEICQKPDCGVDHTQPSEPGEPELPVLTHPTGVEVIAEVFPEGVTLTVQDADVASQLEQFRIPESKLVFGLDISLRNADSSDYQPGGAMVKIPVSAPVGTCIGVLHDHNGEVSFMGVTEVLSDGTIEFYTDDFSKFAGFTVDFHYNGVDYSIEGLTSILLSELFTAMGIQEDAYAAQSVVFSDNTLVTTTRQDNGDWLLTSLEAFQTEETLIITFTDGRMIVINVTDASGVTKELWGGEGSILYNTPAFGIGGHTVTFVMNGYNLTNALTTKVTNFATANSNRNFTLSFPDNAAYWYDVSASGFNPSLDGSKKQVNLQKVDDGTVTVTRYNRIIKQIGNTIEIDQQRYATIGSIEKRTVKVIVNNNESQYLVNETVDFPNVGSDIAQKQLDVFHIWTSKYLYYKLNAQGEKVEHPTTEYREGTTKYTDSNGTTYTYDPGTKTYTVRLMTRYTIQYDGNNATGGTQVADQACVWDDAKYVSANTFTRKHTATFDPKNGGTVTTLEADARFLNWLGENGTVYNPNDQVTKLSASPADIFTMTAQWDFADITVPAAPTAPTGMHFVGWITADGTKTYQPGDIIENLDQNIVLNAKWAVNSNKLTFNFNDGTGKTDQYPVTYGSTDYFEVYWLYPARSGYVFDGWYTAATGGTQVYGRNGYCLPGAYWNSSNQWIGTKDLTVYAHWIPTYKVTLDHQNATTAGTAAYWYIHNTVYDGVYYYTDAACTAALANHTITKPTKTGYIFGGYYTEKDGNGTQYVDANGVCVNNRYQIAGDVTLYAKWTPITYTVEYDGNPSHDGATAASSHTYDEKKALTPNGYQRSGYKFAGWNTKADGSGKHYADQESVKNLTDINNATVTLYAQWKPIYKITLDSQKQTVETDNFYFVHTLDAYYSDETCNDPLVGNQIVLPVKHGYTFAGYYTKPDGQGTRYIDENGKISSACCQLNQNTTLYAAWDIITYTITYQHNDDVGTESTQTYNYETDVKLMVPERAGYKFLGWTNLSMGQPANNWQYTNYDNASDGMQHPGYYQYGDVTLIARWEEQYRYVLHFHANTTDTVSGMPAPLDSGWVDAAEYSVSWPAPPSRANYDFLGWATSPDAAEDQVLNAYRMNGIGHETVHATLYAVWQRQTGNLKLDHVGTKPAIVTVKGEGMEITLVLDKDMTISDLPTGTYSVSASGAAASTTATVDVAGPVISGGATTTVKVTVSNKGFSWFTGFSRILNIFKNG